MVCRINFRLDNPMDAATRGLFAAQVIWTLANADVAGPYVLEIDGEPLDAAHADGWTTADVASTNPLATTSATVGLHALRNGSLVSVTEQEATPVPGFAGNAGNLTAAALSRDGKLVAAVADTASAGSRHKIRLVARDIRRRVRSGTRRQRHHQAFVGVGQQRGLDGCERQYRRSGRP